MPELLFLSFDISSHGTELNHAKQVETLQSLNEIIREAISSPKATGAVWASGGDGGHVAFQPSSATELARLARELVSWSQQRGISLRIVGHAGEASTFSGADGRVQLAGDGINLCGSLLEIAPTGTMVVTCDFIASCSKVDDGFFYHNIRSVYLKHFRVYRVALCSINRLLHSSWKPLHRSDRSMLRQATQAGATWDVVYHARRILQANSDDEEAAAAIKDAALGTYGPLSPSKSQNSVSRTSLFSGIDPSSFHLFVTSSELVERDDGQVLCAEGEPGDSMFLVLRGELALAVSADAKMAGLNGTVQYASEVTFGPGDVVGELAASLKTKRTATLQSIGAVAVLSFHYRDLRQLASIGQRTPRLIQTINSFLDLRVIDYVCHHAPYLIGLEQSGPLSRISKPWEFLHPFTRRIDFAEGASFDSLDPVFDEPGVFLLASGVLARRIYGLSSERHVQATFIPPLIANLPGRLVHRAGSYHVRSRSATLIFLADGALALWGADTTDALLTSISAAFARTFEYDVFLSFALEDQPIASKIGNLLKERGMSVYVDYVTPGRQFSQLLAGAIASSLLFVVLNTPNLERKEVIGERSWVEKEVAFRRKAFAGKDAILPLRVGNASMVKYLNGISYLAIPLDFTDGFIDEIRTLVDRLRTGNLILSMTNKVMSQDDLG